MLELSSPLQYALYLGGSWLQLLHRPRIEFKEPHVSSTPKTPIKNGMGPHSSYTHVHIYMYLHTYTRMQREICVRMCIQTKHYVCTHIYCIYINTHTHMVLLQIEIEVQRDSERGTRMR